MGLYDMNVIFKNKILAFITIATLVFISINPLLYAKNVSTYNPIRLIKTIPSIFGMNLSPIKSKKTLWIL